MFEKIVLRLLDDAKSYNDGYEKFKTSIGESLGKAPGEVTKRVIKSKQPPPEVRQRSDLFDY